MTQHHNRQLKPAEQKMKKIFLDHWFEIVASTLFGVAAAISAFIGMYDVTTFLLVFAVVSYFPILARTKFDIYIPKTLLVVSLLFSFCAVVLGEYAHFYDTYHWYDSVLHFISAVILGLLGCVIILMYYQAKKLDLPLFFMLLIAFCFAVTIGVVWEVFEFIVDITLDKNMQPSLEDTMIDLIIDMGGALIGVTFGARYLKRRRAKHVWHEAIDEVVDETVSKNKQLV